MSFSKLLSDLIDDGNRFLNLARESQRKGEDYLLNSYCRAVFFSSWSALEGWIKYVSMSFIDVYPDLSLYEKAFLLEKRLEINENGDILITNSDSYKPALLKLQYIFKKFGSYDFKHEEDDLWMKLNEIQKKRNELVHPKTREKDLVINYDSAENCYKNINKVIEIIKNKIF